MRMQERYDWVQLLQENAQQAKTQKFQLENPGWLKQLQKRCLGIYQSKPMELLIGFMIMSSFAIAIAESQVVPEHGTEAAQTLYNFEMAFTILFTLEILFNMFCNGMHEFWTSRASVFDFFIVLISIISIIGMSLASIPAHECDASHRCIDNEQV